MKFSKMLSSALLWKHPRVAWAVLFISLASTGAVEFYESHVDRPVDNWVEREKEKLAGIDADEFCFAVLGDNKGEYGVFSGFLTQMQKDPDILFTVHLGDMVKERSSVAYREFYNVVMSHFQKPFFPMVGNHDIRWWSRDYYISLFGPLYYSFRFGNAQFICMDTSYNYALDGKQMRWLETQLAESQDVTYRFVLMHQPLYDPRGEDFAHGLLTKNAVELGDLFKKYNVSHLFASHVHGLYEGEWNEIPYTISGGAGARLAEKESEEHGFHHYVKVYVSKEGVRTEVVPVPENRPDPKLIHRGTIADEGHWTDQFSFNFMEKIEFFMSLCAVMAALCLLCPVVLGKLRKRGNCGK